jgi:hypothetical protein
MASGTGWSGLSKVGKAGVIGQIGGIATGLIGAYFASETAKYQTESMALQYEHHKFMSNFNASLKETQAQHLSKVHNQLYQSKTLEQGRTKGKRNVLLAARGGVRGVGSNLNVAVSDEITFEIDKATMRSNRAKAVSDTRLSAVSDEIAADQYGLSASNAFATASNISPWMNMSSTLLTGTNNLISSLPTSFWEKE